MDDHSRKLPSPLLSVIPLAVMVTLLFFTIRVFGSDALSGGSQVVLLVSAAVCVFTGMVFCRVKWKDIEAAIANNILGIATAIIILLLIGALSGTWMISGVVPTLIYYGMQIIHPDFFLVSTCVICSIVSVVTGSSWTTVATIGIALMGIGQAQGFSDGWIAGAVISGAYFGDKISPLSDTTILAASVSETPLFTHIRYMMYTTVPSMLITLVIFTVAGLTHEGAGMEQMAVFSAVLGEHFNISLWLLMVPAVTAVLIARRVPPLITLFVSAATAAVFAIFFQPELLQEVSGAAEQGALSAFKGAFISFYGSTQIETGNEALNSLVSTRGMGGMLDTIWLILCAMCFGGAMAGSRMLESIATVFTRLAKRRTGIVSSTVASGLFMNICTADQYISIILTGNIFKDIYKKNGYESRLLSRTTEDSVTVTSVLVPWNTCGMTQAAVLGVATFAYLPYCFFNLISPLMSILMAATGYSIKRSQQETPEDPKESS
ncbi:Malate-2H(+)/Na(+)-lactate antiporter [Bacteroidales bacterium Barb7]|nr:Malate-2H(+)/Na(+)-lactate antiporter [Bacteroidales bacterium Barb7]